MQKYININYSLLLKLLLAGALLSLFLGLYHHQALGPLFCTSLECLFFLSYGEVSITEIKFLFPLLLWLLPQVVLFYFIGNELGTDLERNAVYIFTRTQQRKEWLLAKSLTLFIYILVYFSVQFLVLWAFAAIQGIHLVDQQQGLVLILSLLSLLVLLNVMMLSLMNFLTLITNHITAFTIVFTSNIGSLFLSAFLYESTWRISIIQWLPFTQGILAWHSTIPAGVNPLLLQNLSLSQFTIPFSLIYLVVLTTLFVIFGIQRIEKMDLL